MSQSGTLHVIGGNDRGKRFDLKLQETRIGRGADQDIVLSDIAVSRRHVTIHLENGRFRIQDLGSGNGTLINGQRMDSHVLDDGDHVEIGQTVMRFEHVASRAATPAYVPPQPARAMPPAPSAQLPPGGSSFDPMPSETPSDMVLSPPFSLPTARPFNTGQLSGPFTSPIDTPLKRLLVFGGMGLLSIIGLIIILSRTVFANPPVVASEAEELYKQGLRLFSAGDYDGAKISFGEVLTQVPDSPDVKRYARQCDTEIHARAAFKNAERAVGVHRYLEAVKALDQVDSASLLHDQAVKLRRDNAVRAAGEAVEEARRLASEDPETARGRLLQALELDPANEDALTMAAKLKSGAPLVAAKEPTPAPVEKEPPPPPPVAEKTPKPPKRVRERPDKDPELATVRLPPQPPKKEPAPAPSGGGSFGGNAMAFYKSKDFGAAEKAMRQESVNQPQKQFQKTIETANQIRQLKQVVERAAGEEGSKPDAAIKDYEEALALDGKLGRGMHAAFFKAKLGKLQQSSGQQAFQQGKYDLAFAAAKEAARTGAGDGGLLKQLEAKAAELVQKGQAAQKSNVAQAKQYWRTVIKMVPTTSPNYAKAYQLLNNAAGARRDEDED